MTFRVTDNLAALGIVTEDFTLLTTDSSEFIYKKKILDSCKN